MPYGVTETGFTIKPASVVLSDMQARFRALFGDSIRLEADSALGQQIALFADDIFDLWQVAEDTYNSAFSDTATGPALDQVAAMTGATRLPATKSTVELVATGDESTSIPAGRVVKNTATGRSVSTLETVVLAVTDEWEILTDYELNDVVHNDGGKLYLCTGAGTSAPSTGPTGTGAVIVDNTVTWRYLGTNDAFAFISAEELETGPNNHQAFELTIIDTPISGWNTIINPTDAVLGRSVETDSAFRLRRKALLATQGLATVDAIRASVLGVAGVVECFVFENDTGSEVDGMPAHSVEPVIPTGQGTDAAITDAIGEAKPAGIYSHGSEGPFTFTDSQGFTHDIRFSRAEDLEIYIDITVATNSLYPIDGDEQLKLALATWGDENIGIGDDVFSQRVKAVAFTIPGVIDVTSFDLEDDPTPSGENNIFPDNREIARFDTSRIAVTS
jgi:uncharacterized phage protein gp47/JayE